MLKRPQTPSHWLGTMVIAIVLVTAGIPGCAVRGLPGDKGTIAEDESPALSGEGLPGDTALSAPSFPSPDDESAIEGQPSSSSPAPQKDAKMQPSSGDCYELQPTGAHKGKKSSGRCEPQSLPYARCRSGVMSCRLGSETGPLQWFACERRKGNTSDIPMANCILILSANARRKMPTGHVAYVEDAISEDRNTFRLILSHTNHDRKCSLETLIEARYDRSRMTLDVLTGVWKQWGQGLKVAGFISG